MVRSMAETDRNEEKDEWLAVKSRGISSEGGWVETVASRHVKKQSAALAQKVLQRWEYRLNAVLLRLLNLISYKLIIQWL